MSKPYCLPSDVMNKELTKILTQEGYGNSDVQTVIAAGDSFIDTLLAALGIPLPFASNPPLVFNMSVVRARWACLRDIYLGNSPSQGVSSLIQEYLDEFNQYVEDLKSGQAVLVDGNNNVIQGVPIDQQVTINTINVDRIFTMDDPETQGTIDPSYTDDSVTGAVEDESVEND